MRNILDATQQIFLSRVIRRTGFLHHCVTLSFNVSVTGCGRKCC